MKSTVGKKKLRETAFDYGARLFGVCDLDGLRDGFAPEIRTESARMKSALSIGVPLRAPVMNTLVDRPNLLYRAHYQQVNHILNDISFYLADIIDRAGYLALPIPASALTDWKKLRAHLSHREIAYRAGLGWWGRNNLLVTSEYGSQVRLVTVLTDLELEPDPPTAEDCGDCCACVEACPAGAIAFDREKFDLPACHKKLREFSNHRGFGQLICGLCLKACRGKT